jgi:hypothetical protein
MKRISLFAVFVFASCAVGGTSNLSGQLIIEDEPGSPPTCATSTAAGELCVEGDIESNANLDIAGTATLTGAITASSTLDVTGVTTLTGAADVGILAATLHVIRFCGNGSATGAADYMGPVDDFAADDMTIYAFGGSGCDALNSATIGNVDAAWQHGSFAFAAVAMSCVGRCTGASAANDAITYTLYDDTAAVTGFACTATAWSGDDTPSQCTVRDTTPATIAAGSLLAVETEGTDDACADAGDDFECLLFVDF